MRRHLCRCMIIASPHLWDLFARENGKTWDVAVENITRSWQHHGMRWSVTAKWANIWATLLLSHIMPAQEQAVAISQSAGQSWKFALRQVLQSSVRTCASPASIWAKEQSSKKMLITATTWRSTLIARKIIICNARLKRLLYWRMRRGRWGLLRM